MYPNPQDVLPLPPHPDPDHHRKRAKELRRACRGGGEALAEWATRWIDSLLRPQTDGSDMVRLRADWYAGQFAEFARDRLTESDCTLSQAQFVLARAHGFSSWPKLVSHVEGLAGPESDVSAFERAVDAIVSGELGVLKRLLAAHPGLVRQRSGREHRATLLHYVAANGVENYRQRTPPNIVSIARCLLDAGPDIEAEAEVYGGGARTLGLVVTSAHPREAGVQESLADLLIERGARVDQGIVRSCLMNGCPEVAAHLAGRGVSLTLEEAAGLGSVDRVTEHLDSTGALSESEAAAALLMACWYDRQGVVRSLLDGGVAVGARAEGDGRTALHVAAYLGNRGMVELLLSRGGAPNLNDAVHGTPPLAWALRAWLEEGEGEEHEYRAILCMLAEAGAEVKAEWLEDPRLRGDERLYPVLVGRVEAT